GFTPGAWVVGFFIAHIAINFEHAVVVFEHVGGYRAGEGILGVGVNVHLDDAVGHRISNILFGRTGTTVADQIEWTILAQLGATATRNSFGTPRRKLTTP